MFECAVDEVPEICATGVVVVSGRVVLVNRGEGEGEEGSGGFGRRVGTCKTHRYYGKGKEIRK